MKTLLLPALSLGLALGGCATASQHSSPTPPADATVAAFRYLFANNASAFGAQVGTYCIGMGQRPDLSAPDAAVLAALSDVRPAVRPATGCRAAERATGPDGNPALIFNLEFAGCRSADDCLFRGGYYEGNLSASSGAYRVRRRDGRWTVAPEGPQAIS